MGINLCPLRFYTTVGVVAAVAAVAAVAVAVVSASGTGTHQAGALRLFAHVAMRRFSGDI
jgi:hypothetical protein